MRRAFVITLLISGGMFASFLKPRRPLLSLHSKQRSNLQTLRNYGILIGFLLFFLFLYLLGAEFISAKRGKGEILVFKRGQLKKVNRQQHDDPEARPVDVKRSVVTDTDTMIADDGSEEVIKLQRQTAVFHWKDVCYDIKIKG